MADFEKTITSEIGIEAEADSETTYEVETEDGVGLGDAGEYEHVAKGSVAWQEALDAAGGDPAKAAESLQANLDYWTLKKVSAEKMILQTEALSLQDRINEIKNLAEYGHEAQIWCADLTEDLSGDVGIIEVPGEQTARNVQPGYNANAVYSGSRDGQILPAIVSTPAATFWNLAMLPGWQKWKPTYRYGTITSIDYPANTCNLNLEPATSSQQNIDVNQGTALVDVPIEYMTCNAAAFAVDDVVLVEFTNQDFTTPKVIGFKDHPQPCGARYVVFKCWAEDPGAPPTTYDAHYVVWDAQEAQLADLSAWGGPELAGDYPCSEADLAAWVAATTEIEAVACYDWAPAGEETPSNDVSGNNGCGELVNSDIQDAGTVWLDCPDWDEGQNGYASWDHHNYIDTFYPAYRGVVATQGDSYNLEIVAGLEGEGETTCCRLEFTLDYDYTEYVACPGADPSDIASRVFDRAAQYRRHCPLNRILDGGWLDTFAWLNQEDGGCSIYGTDVIFPYNPAGERVGQPPGYLYKMTSWEEYDTYFSGKSPENQAVEKMARYSGTIMVQCYVFQAAGQYKWRLGSGCYPTNWRSWNYQDAPARLTDAKIAVDYDSSDITGTDPRDQVSITALEEKVEEAMDAAADEVGEGDKRCIDYFEMTMRI